MKKGRLTCSLSFILLMSLLLSGCASKAVDDRRFFWPPLPDVPRIEWLGTYAADTDIKEENFLESITGAESEFAFSHPMFATSDGMGKIFVTDQSAGVVLLDLKGKQVKVVPEGTKLFARPTGIALDGDANIYAADTGQKKIIVMSKDYEVTAVLDLSSQVKSIGGIAIDRARKRIVVPDMLGHKVAIFTLDGTLINKVGKVDGKKGDGDAEFNYPSSVAIDKDGVIIVCDAMNARIQRLSPDLKFLSRFGKRGDGIGEFNIIKSVAVDSEGHIYVTDGKSHRFGIYNTEGEPLLSVGGAYSAKPGASVAPGGFLLPMGIYIDPNDTIYVVDQMNKRLQVFQYMNEKYVKENAVTPTKIKK